MPTLRLTAVDVAPDGRIHASFNQTVARTGRLSSDAPNLHNIPVRSELGRQIRRAFVAGSPSRVLLENSIQLKFRQPSFLEARTTGTVDATNTSVTVTTAVMSSVDVTP